MARLDRDWPAERTRMGDEAVALLAKGVGTETIELRALATAALAAPGERGQAFQYLRDVATAEDRSVVLFRGDSAFAWSGRPRVPLDSLSDSIGVVGTPFYLGLTVTARGAGQRSV